MPNLAHDVEKYSAGGLMLTKFVPTVAFKPTIGFSSSPNLRLDFVLRFNRREHISNSKLPLDYHIIPSSLFVFGHVEIL